MKNLNIFKEYKEYYFQTERNYQFEMVHQKVTALLSAFIYIGITFGLISYVILSLNTEKFKVASFLVLFFSFLTTYYIKVILDEDDESLGNSVKWFFLLLGTLLIVNIVNIFVINIIIMFFLVLSLLFYNLISLMNKIVLYKILSKSTLRDRKYYLVEGLYSIYLYLFKIKNMLSVIYSIFLLGIIKNFNQKNQKVIINYFGVFLKANIEKGSEVFLDKSDILKITIFFNQLEKEKRDAYFFFFYIYLDYKGLSNPILKNSLLEVEEVRRYNFFIDTLLKEKLNAVSMRQFNNFFYYNNSSKREERNFAEDVIILKRMWNCLKEYEPDILLYLLENKMNVYIFLYLQDFVLTDIDLKNLSFFHQKLKNNEVINNQKINSKLYKLKIQYFDLLFQNGYSKKFLNKGTVVDDVIFGNNYHYINELTLGITWIFEDMIDIDIEIVKEQDMLLFWDIKKYIEVESLLEKNLIIKVENRLIPHPILNELYKPRYWDILNSYQDMNKDLTVLLDDDSHNVPKVIKKY